MKTIDGKNIPDRVKYFILAHFDDNGKRYSEKPVNDMTSVEMMALFKTLSESDLQKYSEETPQ